MRGCKIIPKFPLPEAGVGFIHRNSEVSKRRLRRILENKGLVGSPLGSKLLRIRPNRHQKARYLAIVESRLPEGKLSQLYRFTYEAFRAFTAALTSAWDGYQVPEVIYRECLKQRLSFLNAPAEMTRILKSELQSLRDYVLSEGLTDTRTDLSWFFPRKVRKSNLLQASAALRALPAPLSCLIDGRELRLSFKERWTTDPPIISDDFKQWIKEWVDFNQPYYPRNAFPILSSTRACLEFSRRDGGLRTAIIALSSKFPLSTHEQAWYDNMYKKLRTHCRLEAEEIEHYSNSLQLVAACVSAIRPFFVHTRTCEGGCREPSLHPPMRALLIPERGYKVRVPTMTTAPISILARVLRSMADPYLRSDPRIKPSLEGETKVPPKRGEFWRSQDLTTATDLHAASMTRWFYTCIGKNLPGGAPPWFDDVVNTVCGFYTVVGAEEIKDMRARFEPVAVPPPDEKFKKMLGEYSVKYGDVSPYFPETVLNVPDHLYERFVSPYMSGLGYSEYLSRVGRGYVTRCGQPMGISTSWPLLPIVTLYCYERSLTGPPVTISRRILKRPFTAFDMPSFTKWCLKQAPKLTVRRQSVKGALSISTTGDDAITSFSKEESLRHTQMLESIGSKVSSTKDYLSRRYSIYTEVMYKDGEPLGIFPWAPILAPKGVRQNTWYSQMRSLRSMEQRHRVAIPLSRSPFFTVWKYMAGCGTPVGADPILGGLGIPNNPPWISALSVAANRLMQRSEEELLKYPPGFFIPLKSRDGLLLGKTGCGGKLEGEIKTYNIRQIAHPSAGMLEPQMTRCLPSPTISLSISRWVAIFRSMDTWSQIVEPPQPEVEPTISQYMRSFRTPRTARFTLDEILEIVDEAKADMEMMVEIPWGVCQQFHPVFGYIFPQTPIPVMVHTISEMASKHLALEETDVSEGPVV